MRKIGPDGRSPLRAQNRPQGAQKPAHAALFVHALRHRVAQPHRLAEVHQGVATVDEHGEKLAETSDQHPVFRKQQAPKARFPMRRTAPENGDRHQIDVELRMGRRGCDQLHQNARRAHRVAPEYSGGPYQVEVGLDGAPLAHGQAPLGTGKFERRADIAEHGKVGLAFTFEHVAHRPRTGRDLGGGVVRFDGRMHP